MKISTATALGKVLDYLVATCEGVDYLAETTWDGIGGEHKPTHYSTDWSLAGPIIEREYIEFFPRPDWPANLRWSARKCGIGVPNILGPTPRIAAMRAYCLSKLGGEVEIPEELTK